MLEFESKTHTYKLKGLVVPSVTQVLEGSGLVDFSKVPKEVLEASQRFGTAVHRTCELHDQNNLNMDTLDEQLKPYLQGWIKFCKDFEVRHIEIEKQICSIKYQYAGTLDRVSMVKDSLSIVDIKTGDLDRVFGLQTSAYEQAYKEMQKERKKFKRYSVKLVPGKYKILEYKSRLDLQHFLSALDIANFKKEAGKC